MCIMNMLESLRYEKRTLHPLRLTLQIIVSHFVVTVAEPRFSSRTASVFKFHAAFSAIL